MHYSENEFEPLRLEQMLARVEKGSSKEGAALVEKAFHFAENAHSAQRRKSGEPYFIHPQFVASILIQLLIDPPMIAAALLHLLSRKDGWAHPPSNVNCIQLENLNLMI